MGVNSPELAADVVQASVIGSMLLNEKVIGRVLQQTEPSDFTLSAYRTIYLAIRKQFGSGQPVDLVTLLDTLKADATVNWVQLLRECMHPFRVDREKNFETLARYFCKEQRDMVGQRLWSCSRNLKKPEPDSRRVGNDEELTVPEGATVLMDTGDVRTAYGHYRFVKYLAKGWTTGSAPRARRKRRRKPPRS